MGYTTNFDGAFQLNKPLLPEHTAYLHAFNNTRRMKRSAALAAKLPDPVRVAAGLPIGTEGGYFVGGIGFCGQDKDPSAIDSNDEPFGQPGLWCQWIPSEDGSQIIWDGGEKFYRYTEWLQYIIDHFLAPWGYSLSGSVTWQGESADDIGTLSVVDGKAVAVDTEPKGWDDYAENVREAVLARLEEADFDSKEERRAAMAAVEFLRSEAEDVDGQAA